MRDVSGKIAIVTGGGNGMGRELVRQLVAEGCNVSMCDVSMRAMQQTRRLCESNVPLQGRRITTHRADVSDEAQVLRFRDEVAAQQETDRIHLLFNNAGIAGGGSLFSDCRSSWERTFNICWGGVYLNTRAFLPMLRKADSAHIVNTSSICGFWASAGPHVPHTAYSAAKFAIKGFTEALIADLRVNAPHIKCSVVIPGHVGTPILANSHRILTGSDGESLSDVALLRRRLASLGSDVSTMSDDAIRKAAIDRARRYLEEAPTTAQQAATIILDGVKADRWRILVGKDAEQLDELVREVPEKAYEVDFYERFAAEMNWLIGR
jgi:NAD(P)-dependent dehydrogenase (short-subunit alcohol dehydrogenase family)